MQPIPLEELLANYKLPAQLGFGQALAPVMYRADFRDDKWDVGGLVPYAPIAIDPAATVLQYAQQAFEGLKAYKVAQPEPTLFRPELNYFRLLQSSRRMCMPTLPAEIFARAVSEVTTTLTRFIPGGSGQSLYLRPFLMGTGPCLAVRSSDAFTFLLIASPSDTYFSKPIRVMVEREHCRAAVGGTGADKVGGNYAASLQATTRCIELGFDQPLWLDPKARSCIEELSGMNLVAVIDGPAQPGQGLAQIAARCRLGPIRPQQTSQRLAPVGAIRFNGQIGQQRPCPVGGEGGRLVVQRCLEGAQK